MMKTTMNVTKMKKQMTYANNNAIPWVALVGSNEMADGIVSLKNMESGEQQVVKNAILFDKSFLRI